jgi:hypothetical protein
VLALTAAVVAFGLLATGGDENRRPGATAKPSAPEWSARAGERLAALPGLRYAGTLTVQGRPVQVRLTVTRSGLATGTLTAGAGAVRAELVAVDGATYVKGGTAFWQSYSGEAARTASFAGRWAKVPSALSGLADIEDLLAPGAITKKLNETSGGSRTENIGGTPAYRVKTSDADYFVSAAAPYRLVRVRASGRGGPELAVSPLVQPALAFSELRPRVAALGRAGDPGLRFQPGNPRFVNCTDNLTGCTMRVPATLTSPEGTDPVGARAAVRATITAEGRTLGSCSASAPVPAGRNLELSCKVGGPGWQAWLREVRESPGAHPYEGHARVIGEAVASSDVGRLLELVDRERAAVLATPPASSGPAGPAPSPASTP